MASRPATLPPDTQTTSCSSRCAVTSSTLGIGNVTRCVECTPRSIAASWNAAMLTALSPSAVSRKQILGARPVTPESSIA